MKELTEEDIAKTMQDVFGYHEKDKGISLDDLAALHC